MYQGITSTVAVATLVIAALFGAPAPTAAAGFWASYWQLFDGTDYFAAGEHFAFDAARMSADGTTLFAEGHNSWTYERKMFFFDTATGAATEVFYPSGVTATYRDSVAITADGSRAFFADYGNDSLYRVDRNETGVPIVTKILDHDDYQGTNPNNINGVYQVRTLPAGDAVYFNEDRDGLWRLDAATGIPTLVVDDAAVPRDGGIGWAVSWFDVSDDGSVLAFTLTGYDDGATHQKHELFVGSGGAFSQLTNETLPTFPYYVPKTYVEINGGGTVITYHDAGAHHWTSIRTDGSDKRQLHPASSNVAGSSMTSDGKLLFFNDMNASGGHLVRTDGMGGIDTMPTYPIGLWATLHPEISGDGSRVSFVNGGDFRRLYVGAVRPPFWVGPGPTIDPIDLDPPWLPYSNPGPAPVLTVAISDPQSPTDVSATCIGHYVNGKYEGYWENLPILFHNAPHDDGILPDQTVGDHVYTTGAVLAGGYPSVPWVSIRVGARDVHGNITVRDVAFNVCPLPGCEVFADGFESGDLSAWSAWVGWGL